VGHRLPVVDVQMASASGEFVPVLGTVDTGAFRTALTFETARRLGIQYPMSSPLETNTACTTTGEEVLYYVHLVSIRIAGNDAEAIEFPLKAAFADRVKRNLFGRDWLAHLCLAVDREAVHFLRD
jgi:predicted aspartyl protease